MTAKEKAQELVIETIFPMSAKWSSISLPLASQNKLTLSDNAQDGSWMCEDLAKQCALIAVDEMLETHKRINVLLKIGEYKTVEDECNTVINAINPTLAAKVLAKHSYWQQVKDEIEKL